ncbi:hypothetical protein A4A49_23346 [Nicotiana attenuata]|uniref:Uncharacterized protein n=1 Tax=Nicotiana attenuata TaxID=49451 RepID=A0A1J6HV20_NICAT|nr:hypothetical protein A4A49_23346 [Nicotiana attenuata]
METQELNLRNPKIATDLITAINSTGFSRPHTAVLAGDCSPWPGTVLQFSAGKPANLPYHPKSGPFSQSHYRSAKQGFGDVWRSTMAIDGAIEQPQPSAADQRPTFSPQHDASNLQHHSILPRSGSNRPFCDSAVQSPSTVATTGPFIFNAREATLTATGEYLERDIQSLRDSDEPRNTHGKGDAVNVQPIEDRLSMARSSTSGGVQCGPQRDSDPTMPEESSKMWTDHILPSKPRCTEATPDPNSSDEDQAISIQGERMRCQPREGTEHR